MTLSQWIILILAYFIFYSPIILLIVSTILFIIHVKKRKTKVFAPLVVWIFCLFISFSCISAEVWFYNLDAPDDTTGKKMAEPILTAINQYHKENGKYPGRLSSLVPVYIAEIPQASWRHEYCYDLRKQEDQQSFTLAFVPRGEAIGDGWEVYSSISNSWVSVDSDFSQPCHFYFDEEYP